MKRSLYQCFNAKVLGDKMYCSKRHSLGNTQDGTINLLRLQRGSPLELTVCQKCLDYDYMGEPVTKEDRGWQQ